MNKKSLITISIISIFLLAGHAVLALAGTKPSTVQSEIKQLDAVKKSLNKINHRLLKILENPPDDTMPSPNVNGAVGRLGAMYYHLLILNGFIESSKEKVLGHTDMTDVSDALDGVKGAAKELSDNIFGYLEAKVNANTPEEFIDNLKFVKDVADDIVYKSTTNPTCSSYDNMDACVKAECKWEDPHFPGGSGSCKESS